MATAFINGTGHAVAVPFYTCFPNEPILPPGHLMTLSSIEELKDMTVLTLLEAMIKFVPQMQDRQVLVVSHGNSQGLGLDLVPSKKEENTKLHVDAIGQILENMRDNKRSAYSNEQIAKNFDISSSDFVKLKDLIGEVQELGISRIEFRACDVGSDLKTLEALRKLFRARIAGAPKVFDAYVTPSPRSLLTPREFAKWLKQYPSAVRSEKRKGKQFAYRAVFNSTDPTKFDFEWNAESVEAVTAWVSQHFTKGKLAPGGALPFHALLHKREAKHFVFPGDEAYRSHLATDPA